MSKIAVKLSNFPNDAFEFDHNGQIKEFLIKLGITGQFDQKPPQGSKETIMAIPYLHHETHFVLIALWRGYDDPKENGYRIWCFPKKRMSYEQFMDVGKKILNPTDDRVLDAGIFFSGPGHQAN